MAFEFRFPDVGQGITEGEIVKWHVREGDAVKEDQVLVEIETDKAVVEVPSPKSGIVLKRHVSNEGQKIYVGDIIVAIGEKGEKYVPGKAVAVPMAVPEGGKAKKDAGAVVGFLPGSMSDIDKGVFAMPAVRRLAAELKVSLSSVKGTGPGGRIIEEDVRKAAGQPSSILPVASATAAAGKSERQAPSEQQIKVTKKYDMWGYVQRVPLKGIRKATAEKMLLSASKTAAVTNFDEADITELAALREVAKKDAKKKGVKLTFLPYIIRAVVESLKKPEHKVANSSLDEATQEIVVKEYLNIGFAVATEAGLVVPVVKGANAKSILALAGEIQELAEKARSRKLDMADMMGGSFTITNLGSVGGAFFTPIINYPEAAILGIGRIADKPVVKDGKIAIRKLMPLSLTYDHRIIDGAQAAGFLNSIISFLEKPDHLMT
ncbi:MAG TPA: dihydrolipoamide acetyltransferase family protein [Candidatus Nanoarchaeia archaeon]|nr:dihydrolipoamide acetyltransferase family protein [Candidatus Nanoarchaeia archaeon]